eukprot:366343-Chlamydomonas_euryale.AAC.2
MPLAQRADVAVCAPPRADEAVALRSPHWLLGAAWHTHRKQCTSNALIHPFGGMRHPDALLWGGKVALRCSEWEGEGQSVGQRVGRGEQLGGQGTGRGWAAARQLHSQEAVAARVPANAT